MKITLQFMGSSPWLWLCCQVVLTLVVLSSCPDSGCVVRLSWLWLCGQVVLTLVVLSGCPDSGCVVRLSWLWLRCQLVPDSGCVVRWFLTLVVLSGWWVRALSWGCLRWPGGTLRQRGLPVSCRRRAGDLSTGRRPWAGWRSEVNNLTSHPNR